MSYERWYPYNSLNVLSTKYPTRITRSQVGFGYGYRDVYL